MNKRRVVKLVVQGLVSALLVALLLWRIEFHDRVLLADGTQVEGRVLLPDKTEPVTTHVILRDRAGREQTFVAAALRKRPDGSLHEGAVQFGFLSSIRAMDPRWTGIGVFLMGFLALTTGYRWQLLLRVQDVRLGLWTCVKLTVVGFFFDNVMPGSTGGDVVKAYYVARQSHRKAEAAVSVFVDRFIGLFALALLSGGAVLVSLRRPEFSEVGWIVVGFLAAVGGFGLVFYSRRIRRGLRLGAVVGRLPFQRIVRRCDEAVFIYRYHMAAVGWAVVLSLVTQSIATVAMYFIGRGLGVRGSGGVLSLQAYFVYYPVLTMVAALPVTPGGVGWREWAFTIFFGLAGVPAGMGCALAVMYRATRMVWSLPGALFLWGARRVSVAEMERELAEDEKKPSALSPQPSATDGKTSEAVG